MRAEVVHARVHHAGGDVHLAASRDGVDFLVQGRRLRSAVLAFSAANTSSAHSTSNEIFRKWYDLVDAPTPVAQRVTVFDDRYETYKDDDLKRLREVSEIVPLSDRQTMRDLLAA